MSRTAVRQVVSSEVAKKQGSTPTVDENVYTVPAGKTLRIRSVSAGHEYSTAEVRTEFLADGTLFAVVYGMSQLAVDLDVAEALDVTIRRVNGDPGALHMTAWWEGVLL